MLAVSSVVVLQMPDEAACDTVQLIANEIIVSTSVPIIVLLPTCNSSRLGSLSISRNFQTHREKDALIELSIYRMNFAGKRSQLVSAIRRQLKLGTVTRKSLLDFYNIAAEQGILTDEDNIYCKHDLNLAKIIIERMTKETPNVKCRKEFYLPLQGAKLWQQWCQLQKKRFQLEVNDNLALEMQISMITQEMIQIRRDQAKMPISTLVSEILNHLCHKKLLHVESSYYFINWLKQLMEKAYEEEIAKLSATYEQAWTQTQNCSSINHASTETAVESQMDSLVSDMLKCQLNLKHVMRETGQIYECLVATKTTKNEIEVEILPKLAVELLLKGECLELMDGETCHVAIDWIKAVLNAFISRLGGDRRLLVLSVLGLQSSGKSTLLNTMFGLQFSVSAGRCTSGVYIQLLPVDTAVCDELGYDYILVIDTEGLRSPEVNVNLVSNFTMRDNKLATFAIGLSDLSIINIMGENASEIHDILQICIQSILRMQQVKIQPCVIFVHQNVSDCSAPKANIEGRRRFIETLNSMTKLAAQKENVIGVNKFSDVIHFDVDRNVFYFRNLYVGDPPMAQPNISYSQDIASLKSRLLSIKSWKNEFSASTITDICIRLSDLWMALLQENFVFSFRNTLEIIVCTNLEERYAKWKWALQKTALELQQTILNQINSGEIRSVAYENILKLHEPVFSDVKKMMEEYFTKEKHNEILVNWKTNNENKIKDLHENLVQLTMEKASYALRVFQQKVELEDKNSPFLFEIMRILREESRSLQNHQLTLDEKKEKFNQFWNATKAKYITELPPQPEINIRDQIQRYLATRFRFYSNINELVLFHEKGIISLSAAIKKGIFERFIHSTFEIQKLQDQIVDDVEKYIKRLKSNNVGFTETIISELLQIIASAVENHNKQSNSKTLSWDNIVPFAVSLCLQYVTTFQNLHANFLQSNNPWDILQQKYDAYLSIFIQTCVGASSVHIFANFFVQTIKHEFFAAVIKSSSIAIANEMQCIVPAFKGNRSNLEKHILKQLAHNEDFEAYQLYIHQPKRYFEKFIKSQVEVILSNELNIHRFLTDSQTRLVTELCMSFKYACDKKATSTENWIAELCTHAAQFIIINKKDFQSFTNLSIVDDSEYLSTCLEAKIKELSIQDDITSSQKHTEELISAISNILTDMQQGCWERCPFCTATCTNTIDGHSTDHSLQFHRCEALAGWHYRGTTDFAINFCGTNVCSNGRFYRSSSEEKSYPYTKYRTAGPPFDKWSITPDNSSLGYWKWYICRFKEDVEKHFGYTFSGLGSIPEEWKSITKQDVLNEIN